MFLHILMIPFCCIIIRLLKLLMIINIKDIVVFRNCLICLSVRLIRLWSYNRKYFSFCQEKYLQIEKNRKKSKGRITAWLMIKIYISQLSKKLMLRISALRDWKMDLICQKLSYNLNKLMRIIISFDQKLMETQWVNILVMVLVHQRHQRKEDISHK